MSGNFKPDHVQFPIAATTGGKLLDASWFAAGPDGDSFTTTDAFELTPLMTAGIFARNWTSAGLVLLTIGGVLRVL